MQTKNPRPSRDESHHAPAVPPLLSHFRPVTAYWRLFAWEPPTPSYLLARELSSAGRSVARSLLQVQPGFHPPWFAVFLVRRYYSTSSRDYGIRCPIRYSVLAVNLPQ